MKISKLFHWLYAAVMMLPLFLFPIFALAVRSDNNYQPISVDFEVNKIVDFNQLRVDTDYDRTTGDVVCEKTLSSISFNGVANISTTFTWKLLGQTTIANHYYYFRIQNYYNTPRLSCYSYENNGSGSLVYSYHFTSYTGTVQTRFQALEDNQDIELGVQILTGTEYDTNVFINCFDLTQLGLENATDEQINSYFPNTYYSYTLSEQVLIDNYNVFTYDDTDLGSQMVYTAYKTVDKYFNYDNVFNFKDLYTWLETTYFSGTAPMGFFIFWHLLIYWLLTSLLWLLFDVLMYVPMLIHRWLDKASIS